MRVHARAANLLEGFRLLERRVATHRSCNALDAKRLGSEDAQHVATQPHAYIVCQERAVAVAVRAENRIHKVLVREVAGKVFVFLANRFGIHRDKRLAAGKRLHRRTQAFQDLHHDVAAHGGMLVHADGKALQSFSTEELRIALAVVFFGLRFHCRERGGILQHALRIKNAFVKIHHLRNDSLFVLLGNLALRMVELDAVTVGRNVASRDHDGRERLVDAVHAIAGLGIRPQ